QEPVHELLPAARPMVFDTGKPVLLLRGQVGGRWPNGTRPQGEFLPGHLEEKDSRRTQVGVTVGIVFHQGPQLGPTPQPAFYFCAGARLLIDPVEEVPVLQNKAGIPRQGEAGQTYNLAELLVDVADLDLEQGTEQVEKGDLGLETSR